MKRILWIVLGLALMGGAYGVYLYNKPHKNMTNAAVDQKITAQELYEAFNNDEAASNARYLDKTIAVSGQVKEVTQTPEGGTKITLEAGDFGVSCELDPLSKHTRTTFQAGENVSFKGICAGYNLDVQLARCVEIK